MFARQAFRSAQPLKQVSYRSSPFPESKTHPSRQSFRKYSAEAAPKAAPEPPSTPPKKSNLTPIYVAVGLAGLGAGLWRYNSSAAAIDPKDRPKVFNGEGWIDLKVANIETLSHNTKRLRFEFEDKEAIAGLPVACQSPLKICPGRSLTPSSCSFDQVQARGC